MTAEAQEDVRREQEARETLARGEKREAEAIAAAEAQETPPPPEVEPLSAPEELAKTVAEGSPEQAKVVLSALAGSLDEKQAAEVLARVQETSLSPLAVLLGPAEDADQRVRNALAALDYLTATRSARFGGVG